MVTFDEKGFTIRIYTGTHPVEEWMELHKQLARLLSVTDASMGVTANEFYTVLNLLDELMPDFETAKKLV